jgi:hypothetical protein
MTATVVDTRKLLGLVLQSLGATVGVATLFSLAILGITGIAERRDRRAGALLAYGTLAIASLLGCLAAGVYGIVLITSK